MAKARELFELFEPSGGRKKKRKDGKDAPRRRETNTAGVAPSPIAEPPAVPFAPDVDSSLDEALAGQPGVPAPRPVSAIAPAGARASFAQRGRTITLKIEEAAVYGAGTVVLLVLAFLLGRYGRGEPDETRPAGALAAAPLTKPAGPASRLSRHAPVARIDNQHRTVRAPTPAPLGKYSILAIYYKKKNESSANAMKKRLESMNFRPVFTHPANGNVYVYVGSFASQNDPRARETLRRLKAVPNSTLKRALQHATIKTMPRALRR